MNWCVRLNTTLSNLEVRLFPVTFDVVLKGLSQVEQKQLEKRTFLAVPGYAPGEKFEFGVITSFAYPIENSGLTWPYGRIFSC